jgi:hypothetical protein
MVVHSPSRLAKVSSRAFRLNLGTARRDICYPTKTESTSSYMQGCRLKESGVMSVKPLESLLIALVAWSMSLSLTTNSSAHRNREKIQTAKPEEPGIMVPTHV